MHLPKLESRLTMRTDGFRTLRSRDYAAGDDGKMSEYEAGLVTCRRHALASLMTEISWNLLA